MGLPGTPIALRPKVGRLWQSSRKISTVWGHLKFRKGTDFESLLYEAG